MTGKLRLKARVEMHRVSALPVQRGYDEVAAAVGTAVITENGLRVTMAADRQRRQQGNQPPYQSPGHSISAVLHDSSLYRESPSGATSRRQLQPHLAYAAPIGRRA